jgi:hypothetical protein
LGDFASFCLYSLLPIWFSFWLRKQSFVRFPLYSWNTKGWLCYKAAALGFLVFLLLKQGKPKACSAAAGKRNKKDQ